MAVGYTHGPHNVGAGYANAQTKRTNAISLRMPFSAVLPVLADLSRQNGVTRCCKHHVSDALHIRRGHGVPLA